MADEWTPKPGDKAWFDGDTPVVIVADKYNGVGDIYAVRYAERDNFGERATFAADRLELTERK